MTNIEQILENCFSKGNILKVRASPAKFKSYKWFWLIKVVSLFCCFSPHDAGGGCYHKDPHIGRTSHCHSL